MGCYKCNKNGIRDKQEHDNSRLNINIKNNQMKIVKGKLYYLVLNDYTFYVLTSSKDRANIFYTTIFPDENFFIDDIIKECTIYFKEELEQKLDFVKSSWMKMGLLQAQPGCIKFSKETLDNLLDSNELILTNIKR